MKTRNEKMEARYQRERPRNSREKHLCEILRYWGYHQASANFDFQRDRIDVETAIAAWESFPKCMEEYPAVITKKVKLDPREELLT